MNDEISSQIEVESFGFSAYGTGVNAILLTAQRLSVRGRADDGIEIAGLQGLDVIGGTRITAAIGAIADARITTMISGITIAHDAADALRGIGARLEKGRTGDDAVHGALNSTPRSHPITGILQRSRWRAAQSAKSWLVMVLGVCLHWSMSKLPQRPTAGFTADRDDSDLERIFDAFAMLIRHDVVADPMLYLQNIGVIEFAFDHGMAELLFEAVSGPDKARGVYSKYGKESVIEFIEIWVRTQLARAKLMFYDLGLLKPLRKGDLRTVRILKDEREQLVALSRLEKFRQHPGTVAAIQREVGKMARGKLDPSFFSRLGEALSQGKNFEHIARSPLKKFLLRCWASEHKDKKGRPIPPLCCCSDPAIATFANLLLRIKPEVSAAVVRKTWERLGLRKSTRLQFWTVERGRGKIIISGFRRRPS